MRCLVGLKKGPFVDDHLIEKGAPQNSRFQAATGQLQNHGRLKAVRKDIARIYTLMRERELGIETVENA
ncbi:hypothetical protein SFUMM280S_11152 [Streptomyces fumanus]